MRSYNGNVGARSFRNRQVGHRILTTIYAVCQGILRFRTTSADQMLTLRFRQTTHTLIEGRFRIFAPVRKGCLISRRESQDVVDVP